MIFCSSNKQGNKFNIYSSTYDTCGYFASCVVLIRTLEGQGKLRAMSIMTDRISFLTIE